MKKNKFKTESDARNSDAYMIGFIARYVSDVEHSSEREVHVTYYPTEENVQIITRKGKNRIEAFRKCINAAMLHTDKLFGNDGGDRAIFQAI